jgi:monoamine oxidase
LYFCSIDYNTEQHIYCKLESTPMISSHPQITIIGAGLAGLTAAYGLEKQGYGVTVIEARSRPGGRVLTAYNGDSYEELGGKFLDDGGDGAEIIALAQELGVEVDRHEVISSPSHLQDGKISSIFSLFKNGPIPSEENYQLLQKESVDKKSLGELLDLFFKDHPAIRTHVERRMRNFEGSASHSLSTYYLASFWQYYKEYYAKGLKGEKDEVETETILTIKGGNSKLIDALCDKLKTKVVYNSPLTKIERGSDGKIRLLFAEKVPVETQYLLLTIPCSTLCDVEIEKGLFPEEQLSQMRSLQYGTNAKVLMPTQFVPGKEKDGFSVTKNVAVWLNNDRSIMTFYYGGEAGIFNSNSIEDVELVIQQDMGDVKKLFPDASLPEGEHPELFVDKVKPQLKKAVGISWIKEPFSKGSYSNLGAGQEKIFLETTEAVGETVKKVFQPIEDKIFFAGEHTALEYIGTMEGAVSSGNKAQRMLQRTIKKPAEEKAIVSTV